MHSAGARPICRYPAELLAFTTRGQSETSGRLVEHWVDDRPESATTRSDLGPKDVR